LRNERKSQSNSAASGHRRNIPGAFYHHPNADNPDGKLWPGAFTEVHFHIPSDPNVRRVPATALIVGPHWMQVAKVDRQNKVVLSKVQLGRMSRSHPGYPSPTGLSTALRELSRRAIRCGLPARRIRAG
jgi:hypothetical protein